MGGSKSGGIDTAGSSFGSGGSGGVLLKSLLSSLTGDDSLLNDKEKSSGISNVLKVLLGSLGTDSSAQSVKPPTLPEFPEAPQQQPLDLDNSLLQSILDGQTQANIFNVPLEQRIGRRR